MGHSLFFKEHDACLLFKGPTYGNDLRFADYLTKGQFIEDFQSMKKKDNFDLEKIYAC